MIERYHFAMSAPALMDRLAPVESPEGQDVVSFWREAGPDLWFAKDEGFDRLYRDRFLDRHEAAARGELDRWAATPEGALALILLLDQFPRNAFRGSARMYGTDPAARAVARSVVGRGHDARVERALRPFVYLPFAHSESLADQDLSVSLCERLDGVEVEHARRHRDIIRRFGRFPHRNPVLGRETTPDERRYLDEGGFAG
jgi:uncharacterized protein (DUF924 family)